jgi:hypothetical protein
MTRLGAGLLVCAAVLAVLAQAAPCLGLAFVEEGTYYLYLPGVTPDPAAPQRNAAAKVQETVYATAEDAGEFIGPYKYMYAITNLDMSYVDAQDRDWGLWCWGFEDMVPDGAFNADSPWPDGFGTYWRDSGYDCAYLPTSDDWGWITDTDGDLNTPAVGPGLQMGYTANGRFSFWSYQPPLMMYPAFAHGGKNGLSTGDMAGYIAHGYISGPTPEPCTLGLLALSGAAMIRLFKRKLE